ncbi:MAG: methyltransferase [Nitrospirota bacterium]
MKDTQDIKQVMNQMLGGYWITQAIYVAAELGIADLLAKGPLTAEELAEKSDADSNALYRVLRALAGAGIFSENGDRSFSLTPLAENLRSDIPGSQRSFAIMSGAEFFQTWGSLLHSVRTGEDGFSKVYGKAFFEYMTENPDRHRIYDAAMNGIHDFETEPVISAYDFSRFSQIVDIGGGNGLQLAKILQRNPDLTGILFDMPAVAEGASPVISSFGLNGRCRIEGGDFFSSVPAGADAYIMRHVIHDWEDEKAVTILRNCRNAMISGGKILVVESVIPDGNTPSFGKWLDLMMLLVKGMERTEDQYRKIFEDAGLRLNRIVPTAHEISIIEGIAA